MRELAVKKSPRASALQNGKAEDQLEVNPISLKRLFHGWLREVPPRQERPRPDPDPDSGIRQVFRASESPVSVRRMQGGLINAAAPTPKWRILTIREMLGLTRATVRESEEHRTWPPEVVQKFMAAEVVTRKR